jgi:Rrf2 family nitric oxide-sensitive transcriptional repressor
MHLTQFSDYSLRVALYLATHPDRLSSVDEISRDYGISRNHLAKVVQRLAELGVVESVRGRRGGLRLGKAPTELNVGWLVRKTEPHFDLVECFDPETNTCPIAPACGLKGALFQAQRAFLAVLDGYTLADFLPHRRELLELWGANRARSIAAKAAVEADGLG